MSNVLGLKKQRVIELRLARPTLKLSEIAELVGTSRKYVQLICCLAGIGAPPRPSSRFLPAFLVVQREHPEWGSVKIARAIGCAPSMAHHLQKKYGKTSRPDTMKLGAAAHAAGLTLEQLKVLANARHA
jgi:hypothetical protein